MSVSDRDVTRLEQLLPLDKESLKQILAYTSGLSPEAAAEHLKSFLGDSPKALEFISTFNSQRGSPSSSSSVQENVSSPASSSKSAKLPNRKKGKPPPFNKPLPPRQVANQGDVSGAIHKRDEDDYFVGKGRGQNKDPSLATTLALSSQPDAQQLPKSTSAQSSSKPPPSASGPLISDLPNVRTKSTQASRNASPAPKATVNVTGGASMHGASTTLQDLDSAIRSLEIQTNPSMSATNIAARKCSCNATRHPLLAAAPNCLNCGKVICVKEGIGPCTYCERPLLSSSEVQGMIESLKQERGQERMQANNASHRRADVASAPRAFATNTTASSKALNQAKEHRDRLLGYQAENARRTQIIDEAADYETPSSGLSQWSSPVERAAQLKRQQKILREQEWAARPDYEKRKVVVSVDLVGGKVVKRMADVERPQESVEEETSTQAVLQMSSSAAGDGGTFSRNPLMGNLIRPVWKGPGKGKENDPSDDADKENRFTKKSSWRRVQDDADDNEAWILDGGVYGGREIDQRRLGDEEHAHGS